MFDIEPKRNPIYVRVASILITVLLIGAAAGAAFVAGYGLAYGKFTNAIAETAVLKARAADLEAEILHLKNYAVLIDAITTRGQAAKELRRLPFPSDAPPQDTAPEAIVEPEEESCP